MSKGCCRISVFILVTLSLPLVVLKMEAIAAEAYSFDLEAFEAKPFEWGGYAESKLEHIDLNSESAFYGLNFYNDPRSTIDRATGSLQLDIGYKKGIAAFNGLLHAEVMADPLGWSDTVDVYEANLSLKPQPSVTVDLGKRAFKWGTGYAWNPVGFIDRPKDPNNPEDALEGFIAAGVDLIKSFNHPLQTVAITSVAIPVYEHVNEEFGESGYLNFAAKLYMLYRDTDIDLVLFTGNSRSLRYGVDFSRNLTSNFEIHGEYAYLPDLQQRQLSPTGKLDGRKRAVNRYLFGLRYLTENDITTIIEYYHNGAGFTPEELATFYQLVNDGLSQFADTGSNSLIQNANFVSSKGYNSAQLSRNYLYLKVNQKDPFDILYLTPGLITLVNLDDRSFSISPELQYTGFTNWDLRLRYTFLNGGTFTEFAEKQNKNKLELRFRYHF